MMYGRPSKIEMRARQLRAEYIRSLFLRVFSRGSHVAPKGVVAAR